MTITWHERSYSLGRSALALAALSCAPGSPEPARPDVEQQGSGTSVLLQAVSVADSMVVWASGHGATWLRTTDGGRNWTASIMPGDSALEFRDVHARDEREAWLLAAGPGDRSRIYHTDDAGQSWQLQWTNDEPTGFYDCFDFWDERRGIAYGDAVAGALRILLTEDGGQSWRRVADERLPEALPGEGGFAASGTCVVTAPGGYAWIAAGNTERARVFQTADYGRSWSVSEAPVLAGEGAGLTSVSMADRRVGTAFGGSLLVSDTHTDDVVRTSDGGRSWTPLPHLMMLGPVYGGTHVPGTDGQELVAVGPGGADISMDGGQSWSTLDARAWWGIASGGAGATWITGPGGRVARIRFTKR